MNRTIADALRASSSVVFVASSTVPRAPARYAKSEHTGAVPKLTPVVTIASNQEKWARMSSRLFSPSQLDYSIESLLMLIESATTTCF